MKKKVAVLFFGLTRSLRNTYANIKENIFDQLTNSGYEYDTFLHTYLLDNPYINPWSGEKVSDYDNSSYKILNPRDYILQKQKLVEQNLRISQYFAKLGNWAGCADTINMKAYLVRNMVLALHSKKKVVELFSKYKSEYDYVIIARPDQVYNTRLNVNSFKLLNTKNIIIPVEHSYHGYNDRFCIATPEIALKYGLAFDSLKKYSQVKSIVSEVYMKDYLTNNNISIIFSNLKADLLRC
jgi:hypothetical protein